MRRFPKRFGRARRCLLDLAANNASHPFGPSHTRKADVDVVCPTECHRLSRLGCVPFGQMLFWLRPPHWQALWGKSHFWTLACHCLTCYTSGPMLNNVTRKSLKDGRATQIIAYDISPKALEAWKRERVSEDGIDASSLVIATSECRGFGRTHSECALRPSVCRS